MSTLFLKEIQMENFKSFGRKITVPFLQGYTAITGPNGSGKSNIADAILFVLGPKSSKAIRAGKLTDLIWNGGKDKKGADSCQVSLLFDNSDRQIPVEADEVKLTRYVGLSPSVDGGYNSYFYINDRKSSLSEFDSLLAHARISAEGYNLVQQGDVQKIVSMSSIERRRILDNIAGITKFDDDIAQAEGKRRETEENLERIRIILDEIDKQIKQLEADRDGALRYKELNGRMSTAKAQLAYKNRELIERQIVGTNEQIAKHEADKAKLEAQKAELRTLFDAAVARLNELEQEMAERGGEEAKQLKEKLDGLRIERARATDGIETSKEVLKQLRVDAGEANREQAKIQKETDALAREREKVDARVAELDEQIKAADKDLHEVDELASKSDAKVLGIQKQIIALNNEIDQVEERVKGIVLEGDRTKEAMSRLESEITQIEESRKAYQVEHDDADWQLKELRTSTKESGKSLQKLQQEFLEKRAEEAKLAKEQAELQTAILSLTRQYAQLKAEADVAENMKRGYTSAVSSILECRETGSIKGIHGTVAQLAHVETQYETAIVTAAGARMQAIIVDDDSVAALCIDYLKKRKIGRATFLPLTKMLVGKPRGKAILVAKECLGFAIDLCHFDEKYRDAFFYVFGDTLVVQTLDEARKWMGGVRLVTIEGELIEASGAMIGGDMERSTVKFGPSVASEMEKIAEKLREAQAHGEIVANRLDELRKAILDLEGEIKDSGGRSGAVEVKTSTLEAKRKEFAAKLATADKDLRDRKDRFGEAQTTAVRIEEDLTKFTQALEALKGKRDERKKAVIAATPQQISSRMKELMNRRATLAEELSGLRSKLEAMATQTTFLEERRTEVGSRLTALDGQRKDHEKRIDSFQESLGRLETEIRGLEKTEAQMGKKVKDLQDARDAAYKEKTDREADLDKVTHKIDTKEDFLLKMQTELKVQEEQFAEAERVMKEMAVELQEGRLPSLEELKTTIADCEAAINALGPINLRALEDYDAQQTRAVELKDEFKRLEGQREELIHLVDQLTDKKKEGLAKIFTSINENFARVYGELTEGGEAELALENPEKPFEGGLLLKVKPAHKKALRLEALSGGERSLASMALIFAIQEYDPSPFYLLDEIDQNLDAVNAEKVARMIRRNSATAQFVQISLRKVSLKEADHLVGVTMTPDSLSEVIMRVNLAEVEDEKPTEVIPA
ncbi:MAG TPA: chromosome segregation protein SMC [Thermoplasmata archaeon]|nr:chromosome segregation protein SMC [Thermoplasmata archaeon]